MEKIETLSADDPLVRDVVELLRELLHALLMASVPAWLDLQLSLPQLRIVFIVAHNETASVMQIAEHLGIGEPTASHLVDKLVRAGLLDRTQDPVDRRRVIVQLSPAGAQLIENLLGWEELLGGWLHQVPEADLSHFQQGLSAVIHEINGQPTKHAQVAKDEDPEGSTR